MDIEKSWKAMGMGVEGDLRLQRNSDHPLERLHTALRWNIGFAVVIATGFVSIAALVDDTPIRILFIFMFLFCAWAVADTFRLLRNTPSFVSAENSVLETLRAQHRAFTSWMRVQQRVALIFYPVSAAGGFLLGGAAGAGDDLEAFLSKPGIWWILLITLVILTPVCFLLGRWMFKVAFGGQIERLREMIEGLEK